MIKALSATAIMIVLVRVDLMFLPYQHYMYNELEIREISASIITLYAGIFFTTEEEDQIGLMLFA
jgi:hypothetical protein